MKKRYSKAIIVVILVVVILAIIIFTQKKHLPREQLEDQITQSKNKAISYYMEHYDHIFRNTLACQEKCDEFKDESLKEGCEDVVTKYRFIRGLHTGDCTNIMGTHFGELHLNLSKVCEGVVNKNCNIGGIEEEACLSFFDPETCRDIENQPYSLCKEIVSTIDIQLKAMEANDPEICNEMKPIPFEDMVVCQTLVTDNCEEVFDNYATDLAIIELKKVNKLEEIYDIPDICEGVTFPEIKEICQDNTKTWEDFDAFRYGKVLMK